MVFFGWHGSFPCLAPYGAPPGSLSNFSKFFPPLPVTFSPTVRSRKSFSRNTYGSLRKWCKQRTYGMAKSFRSNTYKNWGEGCNGPLWSYLQTGTLPRLIPFVCHSYENCRGWGGILPNLELASHHSFGSSLRLDPPQFSASGAAACGDSFFSPEPFDFQLSTLSLFCLGSSRVTEHGAHFPKGSRRRLRRGEAKPGWRRRPSTRNRGPARKIGDAGATDRARARLRDDPVWRIPCVARGRIGDKPRPTLPFAGLDAFLRGWRPRRSTRCARRL